MDTNLDNNSLNENRRIAVFAEEIPALEAIVKFLKTKWLALFKSASLVFGFSIFLVYFVQNGFYPDVDLLGFGSLLLISAFVGAILTAYLAFGLAAPTVIWKEFYSDTDVMTEIRLRLKEDSEIRKFYGWVLFPGFLVPVALGVTSSLLLNLLDLCSISRITIMVCVPLLCSGVVTRLARKKYSLSQSSCMKSLVFAFIAYLVAELVLLLLCFTIFKARIFSSGNDDVYPSLLMALAVSIALQCAMTIGLHLRRSYAVLVGCFVGLMAMTVSGVWLTMPGAVVRNLGIGNYTAESVLIKDEECKRLKSAKYLDGEECVLRSVHVVWAWAGSYQFRFADGRRIRIDKESVGPIVESPKQRAASGETKSKKEPA
jgi:hypothetical protein